MIWNYLVYLLWRFSQKKREEFLPFKVLSSFVFEKIGREKKLFLYSSEKELLQELEYLEKQGLLELSQRDGEIVIKVNELLERAAEEMEEFPKGTGLKLLEGYLREIEKAVNEIGGRK